MQYHTCMPTNPFKCHPSKLLTYTTFTLPSQNYNHVFLYNTHTILEAFHLSTYCTPNTMPSIRHPAYPLHSRCYTQASAPKGTHRLKVLLYNGGAFILYLYFHTSLTQNLTVLSYDILKKIIKL